MLNQIKVVIFFNSERGLKVLSHIKKKTKIQNIFIAKKNLKDQFLKKLRKKKINLSIIKSLKEPKILKALRASDLGIVCGFPYIFKKKLLKSSKFGLINCHAGMLPKYRGGSPLNWQIINDENFFGLSVIKIDEKIDTGEIIEEKRIKLLKKYNIKDLHKIANDKFPKMVENSILKLINNVKNTKQSKKNSNYFKQRNPQDSEINFKKMSMNEIKLYLRALQAPYPEPYFIYDKKKIIIKKIFKTNKKINSNEITKINKYFYVKCKDAKLKIDCNFN